MAGLVAPCLDPIAADFHLAPAPRVTLAGVQEQPATVLGLAGAHALHLRGYQEVARRERQHPHRQLCIRFFAPPGPRQAGVLAEALPPTQRAVTVCGVKVALERLQVTEWRRSPVDCGVEGGCQGFAQRPRAAQRTHPRRGRDCPSDLRYLRRIQQLRLTCELQQMIVALQAFDAASAAEAVVQRVHEVEHRVPPAQVEACRLSDWLLIRADYNHQSAFYRLQGGGARDYINRL